MKWKTITEYEGRYEISDLSLIREISTGRYLKHYPYKGTNGIRLKVYINLENGSYFLADLAKLVAKYFIDNPDNLQVVDFKDGDSFNCVASNLYYRDMITTNGYFHTEFGSVPDDEYIEKAIIEYRKKYPNDYYITDEDLRQELEFKMFTNKEKGVARTMHFGTCLRAIHNRNKDKFPSDIETLDFDGVKDEIINSKVEDEFDKVDTYSYLVDKLKYYMENTLTPRECAVLKFRYGLFPDSVYQNLNISSTASYTDKTVYSLEDAGRYFGVTRERIRQLEVKALRKLRHYSRLGKHIEFMEVGSNAKNKVRG